MSDPSCVLTDPGTPPKPADESLAWPLACIIAFLMGAGTITVLALVSRVDSLKEQLQREREAPTVIVVKGGGQ